MFFTLFSNRIFVTTKGLYISSLHENIYISFSIEWRLQFFQIRMHSFRKIDLKKVDSHKALYNVFQTAAATPAL